METINRAEKNEYLDNVGSKLHDRYFTFKQAANLDMPVNGTLAYCYDSGINKADQTNPLHDFGYWLERSNLGPDFPFGQAIDLYGESIKQEHKRIDEIIKVSKPILSDRLDLLSAEGHLPPVLAERMHRFSSTSHRFVVFDSFAVSKIWGSNHWAPASYLSDIDTIHFRPFSSQAKVIHDYVHETMHSLSGESMRYTDSDTSDSILGLGVFSSRRGLATHLLSDNGYHNQFLRHRAINEAVTEYITNIVMKDLPGIISSEQRNDKDTGGYKTERQILQILADRIGLDVILNAYAEDYNPAQPNTSEALREFVKRIRKAYGPAFLKQLDEVGREQGADRALDFMRAADYLAGKKAPKKEAA